MKASYLPLSGGTAEPKRNTLSICQTGLCGINGKKRKYRMMFLHKREGELFKICPISSFIWLHLSFEQIKIESSVSTMIRWEHNHRSVFIFFL